jgi:uracil-DNA glycosylase family 4
MKEYRLPNLFNYGGPLGEEHVTEFALKRRILECHDCFARNECSQPLWPLGESTAKIMVVARNPGNIEDRHAVPYYGSEPYVHFLLTYLFEVAGIKPHECYFSYAMFCHTLKNRKPLAMELRACLRWKRHEILALPNLRYILLLGDDAMKQFGFRNSIISQWGQVFRHQFGDLDLRIIPCYHPMKVIVKPETEGEYREFFNRLGQQLKGGEL